jgi:hypothetical protein
MTPEVEGIFLVDSEDEVEWFAHMGLEAGHESVDVWELSLPDDAEFLESDEGYPYVTQSIPPDSIRLHTADWTSRDPSRVAGDFFRAIYYGDGTLDAALVAEDALLIDVDGRARQGLSQLTEWARSRAHGPPPRPETRADGVIELQVIGGDGFSIEGLAGERALVSPPRDEGFWAIVRVRDNRVVEVREFKTRGEALAHTPS